MLYIEEGQKSGGKEIQSFRQDREKETIDAPNATKKPGGRARRKGDTPDFFFPKQNGAGESRKQRTTQPKTITLRGAVSTQQFSNHDTPTPNSNLVDLKWERDEEKRLAPLNILGGGRCHNSAGGKRGE